MANSKNQLRGVKQLAGAKPKVPGAGSLAALEGASAAGSFKPGRTRDTSLSSLGGKISAGGLRFGGSSSSATTSSTSGSQLSNLLKQTARGGISNALGGGLKDIGGIASIVSGFIGLFGGGKSTPPPLVHFEAPSSQNQTAFVGSSTRPANWSESATSAEGASSKGIYASGTEPNVQSLQYQSAQIAQAVKQALLNSSSLNDVIAEI